MTDSPLLDYVAAEIRAEMGRQRKNQRQLAEALGISQAQASERARGIVAFDVRDLEVISRWLDVPVSQFLPATICAPVGAA